MKSLITYNSFDMAGIIHQVSITQFSSYNIIIVQTFIVKFIVKYFRYQYFFHHNLTEKYLKYLY